MVHFLCTFTISTKYNTKPRFQYARSLLFIPEIKRRKKIKISTKYLILNASKASNGIQNYSKAEAGPHFHFYQHYETSSFFGFVKLFKFLQRMLKNSTIPPSIFFGTMKLLEIPIFRLRLGFLNIYPPIIFFQL